MNCNECPFKEKCDRRFELAVAGATEWYCEKNAKGINVPNKKDDEQK